MLGFASVLGGQGGKRNVGWCVACRLGDGDAGAAPRWSQDWQRTPESGMLEAALEESEARASALDLENARLKLALVRAVYSPPKRRTPLFPSCSCGAAGAQWWHAARGAPSQTAMLDVRLGGPVEH